MCENGSIKNLKKLKKKLAFISFLEIVVMLSLQNGILCQVLL